jgi:hypothetical protein
MLGTRNLCMMAMQSARQACDICFNHLSNVLCSLQIKTVDKEIFSAVRSQSHTQTRSRCGRFAASTTVDVVLHVRWCDLFQQLARTEWHAHVLSSGLPCMRAGRICLTPQNRCQSCLKG